MKLAIYQANAFKQSIDERLAVLDSALLQKINENTDLVLCPELFISGYGDAQNIRGCAYPTVQTRIVEELAKIARRYQLAICCGYPEIDPDPDNTKLYNSALCVSAKGEVIANHRKRVLPSDYEKSLFSKGKKHTIFTLPNGWCVGLLICYEAEFPEAVRACALAGAQLILVPTALDVNWSVVSRNVMPTRAFENGVYFGYANYAGKDGLADYIGDSVILSPMGVDLARADRHPQLICAELDASVIDSARIRLPYLNDFHEIV